MDAPANAVLGFTDVGQLEHPWSLRREPPGSQQSRLAVSTYPEFRTQSLRRARCLLATIAIVSARGWATNERYDDNGNITSDSTRTFAYSDANRLATVNDSAPMYTYDGFGRLVTKASYDGTTYYFYDPAGRLLT